MDEKVNSSGNELFPVFLKLDQLQVLVIGGGNVALEKVRAIFGNAPKACVQLVSPSVLPEIRHLSKSVNLTIVDRLFEERDILKADIVISAVNDHDTSRDIHEQCRRHQKLINVADDPELCDFYLSSIVQKGQLKIAISTNGKSPTIAKRVKEVLNEVFPPDIDKVLDNMSVIRSKMGGDFTEKVRRLNDLTSGLVGEKKKSLIWQRVVVFCLLAFLFMMIGRTVLPVLDIREIAYSRSFLLMLLTGFMAQMVDGSLGMGYGTISTTFLLSLGVNPAIVSSRVHSARVFSSGVSGWSHHRFRNVNRKLFRALVVPGVIGAALGAAMAYYAQSYSKFVRVPLSIYTIYLGYYIIRKAFKKAQGSDRIKRAGWLASAGGFMDAFAGGGWGALVTSTLIAKRKSPRYVIGSVCLAEFFVVLSSSLGFFMLLQTIPIIEVAGLIAGGLIAAPIAARLVGKLPMKTMLISIGALVILTSLYTIVKVILSF